ncbi:helix-turn-helix domain-containing protein [Streptomyces sioyaensis]|uniref:helix-turn-helix domain-containing protein n=1 Tax=Streptomyces sioyaensis TaxID=67364 RepID=UPI0037A38C33
MTTDTSQLLTVPEVMAHLKFGRSKVYDLIRSKRLTSITEGRSRRIPETALHDYIRDRIEEAV